MSLNGLEDPKVLEAHEAASSEPGGWFLLKYASRDEVELLGGGNGGILEIRNAVATYEESSPLYGMLRYRRRHVLIKYMPEDCSRLVQARAAVHFNAICERLTPYNTTFEIATAKDLKDSKLSAACSLHAASGSSSSSTSSLRRRRLNEIAEEEEEEERERKRQSIVKEEERPGSSVYSEAPRNSLSADPPVVLDPQQITDPKGTEFAATDTPPDFTGVDRPSSPAKSDLNRRFSSQSGRPELYSYATYTYGKAKVKLGPRPSLDTKKRPSTAGNFRPIAALPAGFKFFSRGKKGKSQVQEHTDGTIPEVPQETDNNLLPPRPATSSGASMKSMKSVAPSLTPSAKDSKMTPEKARLMKAMKLREQKKLHSAMSSHPPTPNPGSPPIIEEKEVAGQDMSEEASHVKAEENDRATSNTDSGIAIDLPTPIMINTDARSEDTISDSHPPSPTAASSSEIGDSTKASSLSESTDETIQAVIKEAADDGDDENEDGPEELSEIVEEAGLRMSTVETPLENASESVDGPHTETEGINVSDVEATKETEESHEIPEPEPSSQITDPAVRDATEGDDAVLKETSDSDAQKTPLGIPLSKFSSNEAKSPTSQSTSQSSPTTTSLKSKFSVQDTALPSDPVRAVPDTTPSVAPVVEESEPPKEEASFETTPEIALPPPDQSARRKTLVQPIRTDLGSRVAPHPEASDPLDDDALMEELQSATVQEARPILVSKSPINSLFPNSSPPKHGPHISRTVSSPMRGPLLVPSDVSQSSARSVSAGGAAYLHNITRTSSSAGLQSKKGNLGSSISQRIKALEKLSSIPATEEAPKATTPSSTFFAARKPGTGDPSKSPSVADRASSVTRHTPTPERSREGTPEAPAAGGRERSGSLVSRLNVFEGQHPPRGRPESIQVTARIIRDSSHNLQQKTDSHKAQTDYSSAELKQSPLLVDLQRGDATDVPDATDAPPAKDQIPVIESPKETIQERRERKSPEGEKNRRTSLSIVKDFIKDTRTTIASISTENLAAMSPGAGSVKSPGRPPSSHHNGGGLARRLSISSRRSMSRERENPSTPVMSPAVFSDSGSEHDDKTKSEKKSNKRNSFMRRLSNSLGGGRKSSVSTSISPTVAEEDAAELAALSTSETPLSSQPSIISYMGDVNVQFPDNLLWKRRSMGLDAQGFLFLSAVHGVTTNGKEPTVGAGIKRYHLSDFRIPYTPDVEVQELPNSVVLDLVEGSCLQIACEDRAGQLSVLHALQEAHQNHASFGQ